MKLIALTFAGLMLLAPAAAADAAVPTNVPRVPPSATEPCNLCTVDPAVLNLLIESCQAQPDGTACKLLMVLAGAPIPAAGSTPQA